MGVKDVALRGGSDRAEADNVSYGDLTTISPTAFRLKFVVCLIFNALKL